MDYYCIIIKYLQINLLIFISISNFCYFLKSENFNYNNLKNLKRFRRNVEFIDNKENLYSKKVKLSKKIKKRSIDYLNVKNYREKRMVSEHFKAKWNLPIPYFIDNKVNQLLVESALRMISRETCIKFKKYKIMIPHLSGLYYYRGNNCSSLVGRLGRRIWQSISIGKGCETIGRIQHETIHALGFYHEHSRYDRDIYIYFAAENVDKEYYNNFEKVSKKDSNTFGVPFDFGSVMMYGRKMLSKNGKDTMISRDPRYFNTYGVADQVSYGDVKMLNFYYCSTYCHKKLKCMNEGYQDPNNCNKCKCVKGFIGQLCNMLSLSTKECGSSKLHATNKMKKFKIKGKKNCIYHIVAEKNKKIIIKVLNSFFFLIKNICAIQKIVLK